MRSRGLVGLLVLLAVIAGLAFTTCEPAPRGDGAADVPTVPRDQQRTGTSGERRTRNDAGAEDADAGADASGSEVVFETDLGGTILDGHHGKPVKGARIALFPLEEPSAGAPDPFWPWMRLGRGFPGSPVAETRSDGEGRFAFGGIDAKHVHVLVQAEGWGDASEHLALPATGVTIELRPLVVVPLRYIDILGAPVAGARIWVRSGLAASQVATVTDGDGNAEVGAGYGDEIWTFAEGYAPHRWICESDTTRRVVHILEPGRSLEGRVVDEQGSPVAGAKVEFDRPDRPFVAVTGTAGEFRFDAVLSMTLADSARLRVSATGFTTRRLWCSASDGPVEVTLPRPVMVRVRVTDPDGGTFDRVGLHWESPDGGERRETSLRATHVIEMELPARGPARLTGRTVRMEASKDFSDITSRRFVGSVDVDVAQDGQEIELVLARISNGHVAVRVLDPDGLPVANAPVVASVREGRSSIDATDEAGVARLIVHTEPGEKVTVAVGAVERGTALEHVRLTASADPDPAPVDIRLQRVTTYELRFLDAGGRPIAGADWAERHRDEVSDDDGYAIEDEQLVRRVDLPQDRGFADAIPGLGPFEVTAADLAGARLVDGVRRVDVRMKPASVLQGRVTLQGGGIPAGEVRLEIESSATHDGHFETITIRRDGAFRFHGLPPGPFVLMVLTPDTTVLALKTGTIEAGRVYDLGDVSADPSLWTTTTIVTSDERPAKGATVEFLYPPTWGMQAYDTAGAEGRVRGPPADEHGQVLRAARGREVGVGLDRRSKRLTRLRLAPAARLAIRLDRTSWEGTNLEVLVRPAGTSLWIPHGELYFEGTEVGAVNVDLLPAERVKVRVILPGDGKERVVEEELTLRAGEQHDVTIALGAEGPSDD